jgi:DNA-binding transcriptional ArsR family regulator
MSIERLFRSRNDDDEALRRPSATTVRFYAFIDVMHASTVNARFGGLGRRYGILLPAGRRHRIPLGLSHAEQYLIEQLLSHYDERGVWRSFSQSFLGEELRVSRSTVSEQLKRLRALGLVATRADSRHGTRAPTLFYCLEPYLAVLAMREGSDHFDRVLWAEGNDRLLRFAEDVEWGTWVWDVDDLETFRGAYLVKEYPKSLAVSAVAFVAEEPADADTPLSAPPTQEDSHLITSTSVQEVEALTPKELKTLVQDQPRTSELKTVDNQPATLVDEQPEDSADDHRHGDPVVEEQALDWISKQ